MKTTASDEQTTTTAVVTLDIEIEELEAIMAPSGSLDGDGRLAGNHNETFVRDQEI
jgi:hypothetical protein